MALRRDDLQPPRILRAHRPRTSDALQPLEADAQEDVTTQDLPRTGFVQAYWKQVVAGMCIALGFYLLLSRLVIPFIVTTQKHWNYGYNRVSVTDLDVGHNGMSHFVAQYYPRCSVQHRSELSHRRVTWTVRENLLLWR